MHMKGITLYVIRKGKYFTLSNPTKYLKTKLYESVITRWKKLSAPLYIKKDTYKIEKYNTLFFQLLIIENISLIHLTQQWNICLAAFWCNLYYFQNTEKRKFLSKEIHFLCLIHLSLIHIHFKTCVHRTM